MSLEGKWMKNNLARKKVKIPKEKRKIHYLAGLIDGEGTLGLYSHREAFEKKRPHLFITNNSLKVMKWLKKNFGGKLKRHENGYRWGLWGVRDIIRMAKIVEPFLLIKKKEAKKLISYCKRNLKAHSQ